MSQGAAGARRAGGGPLLRPEAALQHALARFKVADLTSHYTPNYAGIYATLISTPEPSLVPTTTRISWRFTAPHASRVLEELHEQRQELPQRQRK